MSVTNNTELRSLPAGLPDFLAADNGKKLSQYLYLNGKRIKDIVRSDIVKSAAKSAGVSLNNMPDRDQLLWFYGLPEVRQVRLRNTIKRVQKEGIAVLGKQYPSLEFCVFRKLVPSFPDIPTEYLDQPTIPEPFNQWRVEVRKLASNFPEEDQLCLDLIPVVYAKICEWEDLDDEDRELVVLCLFAFATLLDSCEVLESCIQEVPAVGKYFESFLATGITSEPVDIAQVMPVALPGCTAVQDVQAGWDQLCERLTELAAHLKETRNPDSLAELEYLYQELKSCAERLPTSAQLLRAQFDSRLNQLMVWIAELQRDDCFTWVDKWTLDSIRSRWEIARAQASTDEDMTELTLDFSRAEQQGTTRTEEYRTAYIRKMALGTAVSNLNEQLNNRVNPSQRRALLQERKEKMEELLAAETRAQEIEPMLLAAISPWNEEFDYQFDYPAFLSDGDTSTVDARESFYSEDTPTDNGPTADTAVADYVEVVEPAQADDSTIGCKALESHTKSEGGSETVDAIPLACGVAAPPEAGDKWKDGDSDQVLKEAVTGVDLHPVAAVTENYAQPAASPDEELPAPEIVPSAENAAGPLFDTHPGDESDQAFSAESGEIYRPLWRALELGYVSLAYHFAKALEETEGAPPAPASSLLAALALAEDLTLPDGNITQALEKHYATLKEESFSTDTPHTWQTAINLLLAAATMRPILLAPQSGATAVARYLHLDAQHEDIYRLINLLLDYSDKLQGFRLEEATFKGTKTQAAWQQDIDLVQRDVQDWMARALNMTMKFAAASKVWQHWQKPGGIIFELLDPVAKNDFSRLDQVKSLISNLATTEGVHRHIVQTDRAEVGRRRGEDIHSSALDQLVRRVDEATGLARRWVVLAEGRPQASDLLNNYLERLRNHFMPLKAQIVQDLTVPVTEDKWGFVAAARSVVRRSLTSLANLFDPEQQGKAVEPVADELLGRDLLLVADLDHDAAWQPTPRGMSLVNSIRSALDSGLDVEAAFYKRLDRYDLDGARRLCAMAEAGGDEGYAAELLGKWQTELEEQRGALRRQLDHVRLEVELGLAYGLITEAERANYDADLVQYESNLEHVLRFDNAFEKLDQISRKIEARSSEKKQEISIRLQELSSRGADIRSVTTVQDCIKSGDILTANEFLQRLENNEQLSAPPKDEDDRFTDFFPAQANAIDGYLETISPAGLRKAVQNGQNFANLDYSKVAGALRKQASDMVNVWLDIKSRRHVDREQLTRLLNTLGFGVLDIRVGQMIGTRIECDLHAESIDDRTICPVPYFGSYAKGRYRVICVWQRPAEEDIVNHIGDSTVSRPTLVLYFGRLTERKRREASRLAKQHHRSFLLIDETLLVYLSAEERSRLAALFEVSLPFAYSAPYDATSSVVPSEMFFGRAGELLAVQGQNGRCFIYGGRQLGKTALLRKAERTFHEPQNRRFARYINLQSEGIGISKKPSEIWHSIIREFRAIGVINKDAPEIKLNGRGQPDAFIGQLRQQFASSPDLRILLLLDEADEFFDKDGQQGFQETARLKGLMEDTERRFKVVFAGLHNVLRMTERANHPLAHLGEPIKIGPLLEGQEWREAENLIRSPFEAAGFAFESRHLIMRILAQTNYYPSLIQLYCSHLLRQMLSSIQGDARLNGPRYLITASHVDSAYRNRGLRDEIRSKFQLTLQLDLRYEVIAYTLAYGVLDGWCSLTGGVHARDISERVIKWWPEGFNSTSDLEFRVLLDEMVGLGVLRQTHEGLFTLRNPNVLLLLGTQDEIEDVLIKDRELKQAFEADAFRARLTDESNIKRDPLTFQQHGQLMPQANMVTILTGSVAAGFNDVLLFLKETMGGQFLSVLEGAIDRKGFVHALDGLKHRSSGGTTVLVVPANAPWNMQWVNDAREKLARLHSQEKFVNVLFLADPATMRQIFTEDDGALEDVSILALRPWKDAFLRQWLNDCELPADSASRQEINRQTGNWPELLYRLATAPKLGGSLKGRLESVQKLLADPHMNMTLQQQFGLDVMGPREVLLSLLQWGEPVTESLLASEGEFDLERVRTDLKWAELMGVVRRVDADNWEIDAIAQRILKP